MPRNGTPRPTASRTASAWPDSFMYVMASSKLPTPGSTIPEAPAMAAGSSETLASPPTSERPRTTERRLPLW